MASVFDRLERQRAVVKEELTALGDELDAIHRRVEAAEALLRDLDTTLRAQASRPGDLPAVRA
ncbi:hypothetical protein NRF20_43275 [Streptomyces sp. R-74717]|uniref:hypothetical protein n=1 Tax=Streptomyces TaxID=1883 RepID=UPI00379DF7A9